MTAAAGDAFEDARLVGRREHPALADQEDVVAGALGHFAAVIEHQGLDAAGLEPLDLRQDVVEVVERFDSRAQGRRVVADRAHGDEFQPVAIQFVGVERDLIGDDDHLGMGTAVGIESQGAAAAGDDHADVAVRDAVGGHGLLDGRGHFLLAQRDGQPDGLGGIPQPVEVGLEAKDLAAVAADALEDPVPVEQAVVEDADLGVFLLVQFTVDVNFQGHGILMASRRVYPGGFAVPPGRQPSQPRG